MSAPTVPVTIHLSDGNGVDYAGVAVIARLDRSDSHGGDIIPRRVGGATDANGLVVLNLFPNDPVAGLGTTGSRWIIKARPSGSSPWQVAVQVPNSACNLSDLTDLSLIASAVPLASTVRSTVLTGLSVASAVDVTSADTILSAAGKLQAKFNSLASSAVAFDGGTVQDVLDDAKPMQSYTALRAYTGRATGVRITSSGLAGFFSRSLTDVTSADNGGTIIVDGSGRRWLRLYSQDVNVKWFGAKGDGITDDTAALQAAFTAGRFVQIPDGTFTTNPLTVSSNTVLVFSPNAVLKAKTGYGVNDRLLNINGVSNIVIHGNGGAVQMLKSEYSTGEQRHCVNITGSSDITIYNLTAKDSGGDGFYVGGSTNCSNVNLIGCIADNNRRQGLSITNVITCNVIGGEYKNTSGTAPEFGIDIESNLLDGYYLQNVNIIGVYTANNAGGGIRVTPQSKWAPVSITIDNPTSYYDGSLGGLSINAAMAYTPSTDASLIGKIRGHIHINNPTIINPQGTGIVSVNWTENAPKTQVRNPCVINAYSNGAVTNSNRNRVGILIRGELSSSGEYGTSVGNMEVINLTVQDTRVSPLTVMPVYFEMADETVKPIKDITFRGINAIPAERYAVTGTPILSNSANARTNLRIIYDPELIVPHTISATLGLPDIGAVHTAIGASCYFTLPPAADYIGSEFTARVTDPLGIIQLGAVGSDVIANYTSEPATQIIGRNVGCQITVKAIASGMWQVINITGAWAVYTYFGARIPDTHYSATPGVGTWKVGDKLWNTAPAAGGFMGWVCVADGTPGTWKTFGAISA